MVPKVSVILTSYNKVNYIGRAVESVLEQTYSDLELIIVDDGSPDDSLSLLRKYEKKDKRIRLYNFDKNKGIPSAHNHGIQHAKGIYCAMIDCDDYWEKDKLEKQVHLLDMHPEYGACFTWVSIVDENEEKVPSERCEFRDIMWNSENRSQEEWLRVFFCEGCKLSNPSMLIRKKIFDEVGLYSYGLKQLQDYDLFVRILKKYNVYVISEELVHYRWFTSEFQNTSVDSLETSNRSNYEYYLICKNFFRGLNDKLFLNVFGEFLKNDHPVNTLERKCEEIFILKEKFLVKDIGHAVAMEEMYILLNDPKGRIILEDSYGIDSTFFADNLKQTIFYNEKYYMEKNPDSYLSRIEGEKEKYITLLNKSSEYIKELENDVKEIHSELEKSTLYINELEKQAKESEQELNNSRDYINELEKQAKESDLELYSSRNYINELEKQIKEINLELCNSKKYISELEKKTNEGFELYKNCNEYAQSLEKKIREFNEQYGK